MAILSIDTSQVGQVGILPSYASIYTTDSRGTIETTGYLNKQVANGASFSMPCIAKVITQENPNAAKIVGWYNVSHVGTNWSLEPTGTTGGGVQLPVTDGHFANFIGTTGLIGDIGYIPTNIGLTKVVMLDFGTEPVSSNLPFFADESGTIKQMIDGDTAVVPGILAVGTKNVDGEIRVYPEGTGKGYLALGAIQNSGGNYYSKIVPSSTTFHDSLYRLPDAGVTDCYFIISHSPATQYITSGQFCVENGQIIAGTSGGSIASPLPAFVCYPGTAESGALRFQASDNSSDVGLTITNAAAVGQATSYILPDPGAGSADFILSKSAGTQTISTGQFVVANGEIWAGTPDGSAASPQPALVSWPPAASTGAVRVRARGNALNTICTITNATSITQDTNYVLTDVPGVGELALALLSDPIPDRNIVVGSSIGSLLNDSTISVDSLQKSFDVTANITANLGGGGSPSITIPATLKGITSVSPCNVTIKQSSNSVYVISASATTDAIDVVLSGDPGAICILNYMVLRVPQ